MNQSSTKLSYGRGFTLVELLIVIAIIGTLVGLLLPAVNAARARARQAQCLNNMKELGTAIVSYATEKDEFPGLVQYQRTTIPYEAILDGDTNTNTIVDLALPWPAKLLPNLDQQGLSEQLVTNNSGAGLAVSASDSIYRNPPRLEIFICPSDEGTNAEVAKLSYVANSGYFDRDSSDDYIVDQKSNGLFHDQRYQGAAKVRLGADIKDGANTTLMLSENIHRDETVNNVAVSWLNPVALDPRLPNLNLNVEQIYGMVWDINGGDSNPTNATQARLNRTDPLHAEYSTPARERYYARPASSHSEVFNVTFAGGNAKAISENIEYRVYQQLMTPNGAKADALDIDNAPNGQPTPAEKTDLLEFMNPPLKESDF